MVPWCRRGPSYPVLNPCPARRPGPARSWASAPGRGEGVKLLLGNGNKPEIENE